ncbi:MAG: phage tail sheath family protein [Gammaproteobacteria bacterium]|nr:MAG: phage tail sheath family protein [Gammaproteobacteria bacterium]
MPSYLHPGVYVEEISSGSKPIEAVGTSTAAFIGFATKGSIGEPTLISKWDDYQELFGGIQETEAAVSGSNNVVGDTLGHSVYAFFKNGGGKAYITRLAKGAKCSEKNLLNPDAAANSTDAADQMLEFTAVNEGTWGDSIVVRLTPKKDTKLFTVEVGTGTGDDFATFERFDDVSLSSSDKADYIIGKLNGVSEYVAVKALSGLKAAAINKLVAGDAVEVALAGGGNGSNADNDDYDDTFALFEKIRDINIICLPGKWWNSSNKAVIDSAVAHCEKMKSRMVIVDTPPGVELEKEKDVTDLGLPTKTYCATYYPWAQVANPYYNAETNPGAAKNVLVQPSAFAAGIWAKTDSRRGVWKAPAGVETGILGLNALEFVVEDAEQDYLNPLGINALRSLPAYGSVVWGARTLATKADPEWRYVPVRRTAMYIEQSIYNGIQWAVFEPNNDNLWSSLRVNIDSFMNGLFRAGAFQGTKASDAFFVRCGLGDTMTQGDIDRGQVIAVVGFAPLKPAEFVILRIQQKVGQQ